MTHLKPIHERLVREALNSGQYGSVDEFLDEALSAWIGLEEKSAKSRQH